MEISIRWVQEGVLKNHRAYVGRWPVGMVYDAKRTDTYTAEMTVPSSGNFKVRLEKYVTLEEAKAWVEKQAVRWVNGLLEVNK